MIKILFLPNWKITYCNSVPEDKQPPDYYLKGAPYWFFRYFEDRPIVDVIDISSFRLLERFEKNKLRFYIWQALRAIPRLSKYDVIVSHGMQSGIVISLFRRFFPTKAKHLVFDIGAFNSAAESGLALKLMQFASKSIDGVIYHTSSQGEYYKRYFPHIVNKSKFIKFGTDSEFFACQYEQEVSGKPYCICVGYNKRDWNTLVQAYRRIDSNKLDLMLVGHVDNSLDDIPGIIQIESVPIKELIRLIAGSKFGVLPLKSFNYSFGQMTLMQQMALGKCVIASKVPSLEDYVVDGETAVLFESENSYDLYEKIEMVNNDDNYRNSVEKKAKEYIVNCCNEKTMAKDIELFIRERDAW